MAITIIKSFARARVESFSNLMDSTTLERKFNLLQEGVYTAPLTSNLALRVYVDSRPHNLEIAPLHKGLVLVFNGKELVEEGAGFGVPVVVFSDKTYFPGSAHLSIVENGEEWSFIKTFYLDTVSRKVWTNKILLDKFPYRSFSRTCEDIYRNYPASQRFLFPLVKLRNRLGIRTHFIRAESRGKVTVTYKINHDSVDIEADFTGISKRHCKKVLLLNEQGSTFFRRFFDSDGLNLVDEAIGPWELVEADWACFSNLDSNIRFCLRTFPNCRLLRGRECVEGRLGWAGIAYELSPSLGLFQYNVRISMERMRDA